jgi:hypothetical protein
MSASMWKRNIKTNRRRELGCGNVDFVGMARGWGRELYFVNTVMNFRVS